MNRNVIATIIVAFIVLMVSYLSIGGKFDSAFWQAALPGLMENLAIAALAAFVFDSIIKKQRQAKYKDANLKLSKSILLQTNLFSHALLDHFGLVNQSQASNPELDFEFAYDQLKGADIAGCFLSEVLKLTPEEKAAYIKKFAELLRSRITSLNEALEKVYPRPDASLIHDWEFADATIEASAMLPNAFIEANATLEQKDRLTPAQLNLLIEIGNPLADRVLKSLQAGLIHLADKARENNLFVSFD